MTKPDRLNNHPNGSRPVPVGVPDPEVQPRATRRTFSAAYKRRIVAEADACQEPGGIGALLRREGLYSSHLTKWRRQMTEGRLTDKEKYSPNPLAAENARLRQENERLRRELEKAQLIMDAQKNRAECRGKAVGNTAGGSRRVGASTAGFHAGLRGVFSDENA